MKSVRFETVAVFQSIRVVIAKIRVVMHMYKAQPSSHEPKFGPVVTHRAKSLQILTKLLEVAFHACISRDSIF